MLKRIAVAVAALIASFGLMVAASPPASASSYQLCGDGWICFYNYTNHNTAGGVWGHRIGGAGNWNTCITMPTSGTSFTNGTAYNATTSIVINNGGTNTLQLKARFYDDNSCTPSMIMLTSPWVYPGELNIQYTNLANVAPFPADGQPSVNDRIGSYTVNSIA